MTIKLLAALLVVVAAGASVDAQAQQEYQVSVSHDFVVTGHVMPAGRYTIKRDSNVNFTVLSIRNRDSKKAVLVLPMFVEAGEPGALKLTFTRNGDQYLLKEIAASAGTYTLKTGVKETKLASRHTPEVAGN